MPLGQLYFSTNPGLAATAVSPNMSLGPKCQDGAYLWEVGWCAVGALVTIRATLHPGPF